MMMLTLGLSLICEEGWGRSWLSPAVEPWHDPAVTAKDISPFNISPRYFFYNLVGMVLLEVKYMKRSKAKIVERKSMKREMVQVCLTKHQLARQKQRQKLNKPPISHDQITSLLSLSNNPDLFLDTLSPLFASDFVALITNQRWMFRTEKNISEIFDRKTPVRIQKLKTAEGEKCKMSKFS